MKAFKAYIPFHNFLFGTRKACLILILFSFTHSYYSQNPSAQFSTSQQTIKGCLPRLDITFDNVSSGNYNTATWIFEKGNGDLVLQYPNATRPLNYSPEVVYTNPGTFDVTLIVSQNGLNADTFYIENYITVFPDPVADFSLSEDTACAPYELQVINRSTPTSGGLTSVSWSFGSGNQNTTDFDTAYFTYLTPLEYSIILNVTDSNLCSDDTTKKIAIYPKPIIEFTSDITSTCELPATVNFQSDPDTVYLDPDRYFWNFGNDSTSSLAFPSFTYEQNGIYDVTLEVVSPQGCKDTITKSQYIQVGQIDAQISLNKDTFCRGDELIFVSNADEATDYEWIFEGIDTFDTSRGSFIIPDTISGWLSYQLIISSIASCTDTIIDSVLVDTIAIDFSTNDPLFYCDPSANVTLNAVENSVTGISSWSWDLEGMIDSIQDPNFVLENYGYYNASLTATSNGGCLASAVKDSLFYIFDAFPSISQAGPTMGCAGEEFSTFIFNASNAPQSDSIFTWEWDYDGDGEFEFQNTPQEAVSFLVTSTNFNITGFNTILQVQYNNGCIRSDTVPMAFGEPPTANFETTADTICAEATASFTDLSTSTTPITGWEWSFGDGGSSQDQNPIYMFQDTGYMSVSLEVTSNGCTNSLSMDSLVFISAPRVEVSVAPVNCDAPQGCRIYT